MVCKKKVDPKGSDQRQTVQMLKERVAVPVESGNFNVNDRDPRIKDDAKLANSIVDSTIYGKVRQKKVYVATKL